MAHTINIDVVDRTIPIGNNRNIPVINQPNPCYGYAANANEVRQLIQLSNYKITEAGTNNPITGNNYYEYFPEEQPGGGGGGGGVTPAQVEAMIANSIDASVSATSKNAIQNKVIKQYVDDNVDSKVDKVQGKGLSTNDYTTTEKTKLEDLADIQSIGDGLSLDDGELSATGGGGGGTSDYNDLENQPSINNITLVGNKSLSDLGIAAESDIPTSGADIGLGNVDNTSDLDKPISTAAQAALDGKQPTLTTDQLAAVNSGITSTDVEQIETNKNNISYIAHTNPFTIYADDFVELTGAGFIIPEGTAVNLPKGEYILSFTASTARTSTLVIDSGATEVYRGSINIISGSNVYRFTVSADCDTIRFASSASITVTNLMIVSSIYYDNGQTEYIGETMTNAELTEKEQANENNISFIANSNVKNMLNLTITSNTFAGVTYTNNRDGTITLESGTASIAPTILILGSVNAKAGTYKLTGCPATGSDDSYRLDVRLEGQAIGGEYGDGVTINIPTDSTVLICIRIQQNYTVDNLLFRPMFKQIGDDTFVPYAMTNSELTTNILFNTDEGFLCKNLSPWSGGTALADNTYVVQNEPISLPAGTYLVSYLTTATSGRAEVQFRNDSTSVGSVTLNNQSGRVSGTVTLTSTATNMLMFTMRACTVSEFMVSPTIMDATYQLYALPNTTLTSGLNSYIENGVRNFAKYNHNMPSWSGVTINVSDDAISVSGTSSSAYTGFICSGLKLLVKEPFVVRIIGTHSGFSIIAQILNASGTRLYWDLSLDRTIPSGYTIEGVYMQRQSATSSVVSGNFNVLITPKAIYDLGVKGYEPYALSNAELTAGKVDRGDQFTSNTAKTYTVENDKTYMLTVVSFGNSGVFLLHKYANETDTRIYTVYKSTNFDSAVTIAATASSNNVVITPNSTWFFSTISCL